MGGDGRLGWDGSSRCRPARPAQWATGRPHFWSAGYLGALARDVDEVAMMAYDTGMPTAATYAGFVRLETGIALRAMPRGVHLLIGLPAYHTGEAGHTSAETVADAIRGVRLALGSATQPKNVGVALYADYSATPADWSAYRADWVSVSHVHQDVLPGLPPCWTAPQDIGRELPVLDELGPASATKPQ